MKKWLRVLPYALAVLLLCLTVVYLLRRSALEVDSLRLRVRNNPVFDWTWEQSVVDLSSPQHFLNTALYNPSSKVESVHGQKHHRTTSVIQTSRHIALNYECRSRNSTLPWRSLPEATRQAVAQRIIVNDEHKLLYCTVPLLSTGPWMKVMYYISPQAKSLSDISRVPGSEFGVRSYFDYLSSFSLEEQERRLNKYLSFMVSRHPFQRLAIAYKLKFESDNTFFHDRYGKTIIKRYRKGLHENPSGNDVTFLEFAQYVSEATSSGMNEHWQPLETLCQPCVVDYDFILHHETMERDADELLGVAELSDSISKFPYDHWDAVEMDYVHQLYSQLPPVLVGRLVQLYRADFALFSYSSML